MSKLDYTKKTLALITGASKGIGRAIAIELSKRLKSDSVIILIARSESGLNQTKTLIGEGNNVVVKTYPLDLASCSKGGYEKIMADNAVAVENAVVFHNVGSTGILGKISELTDVDQWRSFFDLNLFSVNVLNTVFLNAMRPISQKLFVVQISSLCGSQPFKHMGMYGVGKAARNLLFKVLAVEEADVFVLNYSPGPVETDMVDGLIKNLKDEEMKSAFVDLKEKKTILQADVTVNKMLSVLEAGDFKSGDLIDYYDRV